MVWPRQPTHSPFMLVLCPYFAIAHGPAALAGFSACPRPVYPWLPPAPNRLFDVLLSLPSGLPSAHRCSFAPAPLPKKKPAPAQLPVCPRFPAHPSYPARPPPFPPPGAGLSHY